MRGITFYAGIHFLGRQAEDAGDLFARERAAGDDAGHHFGPALLEALLQPLSNRLFSQFAQIIVDSAFDLLDRFLYLFEIARPLCKGRAPLSAGLAHLKSCMTAPKAVSP